MSLRRWLSPPVLCSLLSCSWCWAAVPDDWQFQIGYIGPITSYSQDFLAAAIAFDIDFRKNFNDSLRERFGDPIVEIPNLHPDLRIKLQIGTSNSEPTIGMNTALDWLLGSGGVPPVGTIIGGFHSAVTMPISTITSARHVPTVAWGATSPFLSDKTQHPFFLRTVPPDSFQGAAMWAWVTHFGLPAAALLYTVEPYGEGLFQVVTRLAQAAGQSHRIHAIGLAYQPAAFDLQLGHNAIKNVQDSGSKFLIMAMGASEANSMMFVMEQEGVLSAFQILGAEAIAFLPSNSYRPAEGLPVGFMQFLPVTRGDLFPRFADLWHALTVEDVYGAEARERYALDRMAVLPEDGMVPVLTSQDFLDVESTDAFLPFIFDAGFSVILAVNSLLNKGREPAEISGDILLQELRMTSFEGVSGNVEFNEDGDRTGDMSLQNLQEQSSASGRQAHVVGAFSTSSSLLTVSSDLVWAGGLRGGVPPADLLACPSRFQVDPKTKVCSLCPKGVGCGYRAEDGFPLGLFGPLTSLDQGYLAAAIAFDIDFRKNFNNSLRERFGDPIVEIGNLHPDMLIKLQIGTSNSEVSVGLNTVLDWFLGASDFSRVAGLIGGYHSAIARAISSNAAVFQVPHVAWGATSPTLSDKAAHPYFLRTVPPDSLAASGMWLWMNHFNVPSVVFLYTKEDYGEGYFNALQGIAIAAGAASRVVGVAVDYDPREYDVQVGRRACQSIRDFHIKVVMMALAAPSETMNTMYALELEGMLYSDFQFVGTDSTLYVPSNALKPSAGMPAGLMRLVAVTQGALFPRFLQLWQSLTVEDVYGSAARQRYSMDQMAVLPEEAAVPLLTAADFLEAEADSMDVYYAPLFDAGYTFVVAINNLLNRGLPPTEIFGEVLLQEIQATSFEGVSGSVQFNADGDRIVDYSLLNWGPFESASPKNASRQNLTLTALSEKAVAVLNPESSEIRFQDGPAIFWLGGVQSPTLPLSLLSCEQGFEFDESVGFCTSCPNGWFSMGGYRVQCEPCRPGSTSSAASGATSCTACSAGTFSALVGDNCTRCPLGQFGAEEGQSACDPCPVGTFADAFGQVSCQRCGEGKQSMSLWTSLTEVEVNGMAEYVYAAGSISSQSCGCDRGARPDGRGECVLCTEGLACKGMNHTEIVAGYFADEGLSVFRCHGDSDRCRGGVPGQTCAPGRTGLTCADCRDGFKPAATGGGCDECGGSDVGPLITAIGLALLGLILVYSLIDVQDKVTQSHAGLLVVIAIGQLVTALQQVGVVGSLPVEWEEPVASVVRQLGLLAFEVESLRLSCFNAVDAVSRYCLKVSIIFFTILTMLLVHVCFVMLRYGGRFKERRPSLLGSVGTLFTLFYISVTSTVLEPLQCQEHPNSHWTIISYPGTLCWESREHTFMLVVGAIAFLSVPVAYLVGCIMVLRVLPSRVQSADTDFLRTVSFLFFRFRAEKRYYAILQIMRSFFFAFVLVVPDVALQAVSLEVILLVGLTVSLSLLPWRVAYANGFDCIVTGSMLCFVCIASLYISDEEKDLKRLSVLCVVLVAFLPIPVAFAVWRVANQKLRIVKPFQFFLCHHKASAGAFARLLKLCLQDSKKLHSEVFLDSDDLHNLDDLFDHVGNDTSNLLIIATQQIFTRPWCVGEMCTARARRVNTAVISLQPIGKFMSNIHWEAHLASIEQREILTENGFSEAIVKETLQWVTQIPPVCLPPRLSNKVLVDLVNLIFSAERTGQLSGVVEQSDVDVMETAGTDASSILVSDPTNPEATAAALVLQSMLAPQLAAMPSAIPVLVHHSLPQNVQAAILMCTNGCFENASFISFILEMNEMGPAPALLPVIAEATFQIPSLERLQIWVNDAAQEMHGSGSKLAEVVSMLFKEIALMFQPHHDLHTVLVIRAKAVLQRLRAVVGTKQRHGTHPTHSSQQMLTTTQSLRESDADGKDYESDLDGVLPSFSASEGGVAHHRAGPSLKMITDEQLGSMRVIDV